MMLFRRFLDATLLWLILGATAGACCAVANWWPSAGPRPDAEAPLPTLSGEVRGPSAEEVIEYLNRRGPPWSSPADVVE